MKLGHSFFDIIKEQDKIKVIIDIFHDFLYAVADLSQKNKSN